MKGQQNNGGGSGWSVDGRKRYDALFLAVKADRKKHGKTFNPQLLLFYNARRRREQQAKKSAQLDVATQSSLKRAYYRMDELADDSDEDNDNDQCPEEDDFDDEFDNDGNHDQEHAAKGTYNV